jgi:hypothetical protein
LLIWSCAFLPSNTPSRFCACPKRSFMSWFVLCYLLLLSRNHAKAPFPTVFHSKKSCHGTHENHFPLILNFFFSFSYKCRRLIMSRHSENWDFLHFFLKTRQFITYMLISSATKYWIQVGITSKIGFDLISHSPPKAASACAALLQYLGLCITDTLLKLICSSSFSSLINPPTCQVKII